MRLVISSFNEDFLTVSPSGQPQIECEFVDVELLLKELQRAVDELKKDIEYFQSMKGKSK